jgi:hypothetical protein
MPDPALLAARRLPKGGLIAIGGPPFSGRSPLAAALADWLPNSLRLETIDDLTRESFPHRKEAAGRSHATAAILHNAATLLRRHGSAATVIVVARFETPAARHQAYACAQRSAAAFLYVEARSSNIRSIRRLFRFLDPRVEPTRQLASYQAAARRYIPVSSQERKALPSILLRGVLSDLDDACSAVIRAWHAGT